MYSNTTQQKSSRVRKKKGRISCLLSISFLLHSTQLSSPLRFFWIFLIEKASGIAWVINTLCYLLFLLFEGEFYWYRLIAGKVEKNWSFVGVGFFFLIFIQLLVSGKSCEDFYDLLLGTLKEIRCRRIRRRRYRCFFFSSLCFHEDLFFSIPI
jgi:hypothetical protein